MIRKSFQEVLTEAIEHFSKVGYRSEEEVAEWQAKLMAAWDFTLRKTAQTDESLNRSMRQIFDRLVGRGQVVRAHSGVERFKLERIAPHLRGDLDRAILASANLIKLNRDQAKAKTLSRFSGWLTSIPKGGTGAAFNRAKLKQEIAKPLRSLPFVERRVLIDQGHKLNASISSVLARDGGAIACRWQSHFRTSGYDYREDHKERDGQVYLIRDSWAVKEGFVKVGSAGWSDAITQPAEEPFCRCFWTYLYHVRQLPEDMVTAKGKQALAKARQAA
jgi:hypothetical protein